jgi:YD repeat-containing protein
VDVPAGQTLEYYDVDYARADAVDLDSIRADDPDWVRITRVTGPTPVRDGVLATFDPTMLLNDSYVIRVTAFNTNGLGQVEGVVVSVVGNAKLGEFRLEFTDLQIPLNGIPITITRVYDTREAGRDGDFGFGWTLGVRDGQIRETVPPGPGDGLFSTGHSFVPGKTRVYITNPAGERFTFDQEFAYGGFLSATYRPVFRPDPGVTDTLTTDGRIKSVTDADGHAAVQEYDLQNSTETVRDRRGNPTVITYNDRGNVTRRVQPTEFGDIVTQYFYEDPANPDREMKVINPRGFTTTNTYDGRGNLLTETTTDGTSTYTYNASNKVTSVTDPLNHSTNYAYIGTNLVRVVNPLGDFADFNYDGNGHVTEYTDFAGNTTLFSDFCQCGRPETIQNPDGTIRHVETNGLSQVTDTTDEEGHTTHNAYDIQGRLIAVTDGENNTTRYEYTGSNQTKVIDPLGHETVYGYDAAGHRNYIKDAEGGETFFTYDANGNLDTVKDPVGNVTRYVYDKANRLMREIEEFDPQDPPRLYEYDAAGNRVKATDHNGRVRTFEYDAMNRLTKESWWSGTTIIREITSRYDKVGNLLETSDPDAQLTFTYDRLNRLATATTVYSGTNVPTFTLTYAYDRNGNQVSVVDNQGTRVDST